MRFISFLFISFSLQAAPVPNFSTSSWMRDLKSIIGDRPLTKLVIPGSHDSASDKLDGSNPHVVLAQGQTEVPQIANLAIPVVAAFSKAQDRSVYGQLMAGVRYLDLRVAWRDQKKFGGIFYDGTKDFLGSEQGDAGEKGIPATIYYKNFWTHHAAYSEKFDAVLDQIRRFLDENKEEIIILSFGNLYNMDNNRKNELAQRIRNGLGAHNRVAPSNLRPENTSINNLLKQGIRVIVFAPDLQGFWSWDQVCDVGWANTDEVNKLKEYLQNKLINHCQAEGKLWNFSVTLTMQLGDAGQIANAVLKFGSLYNLDKTIENEKDKILNEYGKKGLNIVTFDFINQPLAEKVINLNL